MQTDYMERELPKIATLMLNSIVLLALVPFICNSQANSEQLDKSVSREIANNENPGFISIDCGSTVGYFQNETGIWYKTDEGFVETGENHVTSSTINQNYPYIGKQFTTLRCFPEGDRNCYTLKPKQGKNNRYLIRAFFSYGNYDGKNLTQSYQLYLGVDLWKEIEIDYIYYYSFTEIIHTPSTDTIHVCLVKTGPTIPCISSLELRLLNSSIYQNQEIISTGAPQPLLKMEARFDVGPSTCFPRDPKNFVGRRDARYKDDVYDRIWSCDQYLYKTLDWNPMGLDESINMDNATNDAYKLPDHVLKSAAQPTNVSRTLGFNYNTYSSTAPLNKRYEYYVYLHFNEIEKLSDGKKRKINITFKNQPVPSKPIVLDYLKPVTLNIKIQGAVLFNISATSDSDAPPILNAYEIYKLIIQLDSPTYTQDAPIWSIN